jgi:hypothetical protein
MTWFGWGSTGPNWRDNWYAHGRPVTDVSEADLDPPAHPWAEPTCEHGTPTSQTCDTCETECVHRAYGPSCRECAADAAQWDAAYRQAAVLIDAAAGGWLANHPEHYCATNDPNCRGECGGRY